MLRRGIRIVGTVGSGDGNDNDAINGGGADINDGESVSERPLMMMMMMMMMMMANVVSLLQYRRRPNVVREEEINNDDDCGGAE